MVRALLASAALVLFTPNAADAQTRPFTAADLVRMEGVGSARFDPSGRWAVVETLRAYDEATAYDLASMVGAELSALTLIDTTGRTPDRRIYDARTGYQAGPFSPDGQRLVIYRQEGRRRDLGVLSLEDGTLQWFDQTAEFPILGRTLAWRDPDTLVFISSPQGQAPLYQRLGYGAQDRTAALWRTMAEGRDATGTQVWSGDDRDRRRDAPPLGLIRVDLRTGLATTLLTGDLFDLELSPDGRRVAVLANGEDLQPPPDEPVSIGSPSRRRRLWIVDTVTGAVEDPLPGHDLLSHLLTWAPRGADLLVYARPLGAAWTEGALYTVGPDGDPRRLKGLHPRISLTAGERIPYVRAAWTPEGPAAVETREDVAIWRVASPSGARDLAVDPAARFWTSGRLVWIAEPDGVRTWAGDVRRPGARFADMDPDGGSRSRWNPDRTGEKPVLLDSDGCLPRSGAGPVCPAGRWMAIGSSGVAALDLSSRADGSEDLDLIVSGIRRPIRRVNEELEAIDWPVLQASFRTDREARMLTDWLLLPQGPPPPDGWPVVVSFYPGRVYSTAPANFRPGSDNTQLSPLVLAGAGYAVLSPSLPLGPDDRGAMPGLADRLLEALSAAAAGAPIDLDRTAAMGHSFGGQGALRVAAQTDRFRAIIASAAHADQAAAIRDSVFFTVQPEAGVFSNAAAGYFESGQGALGALPWTDPTLYVAASPLYDADRIRTPTLLVAGDQDPVSAEQMFAALYRQDKPASLLMYWGEGHNLASPANIIDLHRRVLIWLDEHLAARSPPQTRSAEASPVDASRPAPRLP